MEKLESSDDLFSDPQLNVGEESEEEEEEEDS